MGGFFNLKFNKMYNELKSHPLAEPEPEHKAIAIGFANEMLNRFSPAECNQILSLIRQRWADERQLQIEKAEKHIAALKESLSSL